jgi:hypothetical protein
MKKSHVEAHKWKD